MARMVHSALVGDTKGGITVPVSSWAAGISLVRVEEDGCFEDFAAPFGPRYLLLSLAGPRAKPN